MPTYLYETIVAEGELPEQFEVWQSMRDPALTRHPISGAPVRRVISGGFGLLKVRSRGASAGSERGAGTAGDCCPTCLP